MKTPKYYPYIHKFLHPKKGITLLVGYLELVMGFLVISVSTFAQFGHFSVFSPKPVNVYLFVVASALTGIVLGAGILSGKAWARTLLVFFAGYVILTKILAYGGLLSFKGTILTSIPTGIKDAVSLLYHSFIVLFLSQKVQR